MVTISWQRHCSSLLFLQSSQPPAARIAMVLLGSLHYQLLSFHWWMVSLEVVGMGFANRKYFINGHQCRILDKSKPNTENIRGLNMAVVRRMTSQVIQLVLQPEHLNYS
jgi:hypothetical protein